jgi:hypothetical protein
MVSDKRWYPQIGFEKVKDRDLRKSRRCLAERRHSPEVVVVALLG